MPRKPRNSPNPPGRPPKAAQVATAVGAVVAGASAPEDAAAAAKVGLSTLKRYVRAARPAAPAPPPPPPPPAPALPLAPPAQTTEAAPIDLDPLAMLGRAARGLEKDLASLDVTQVAARRSVWQALTAVARIMEGIRLGRPTEEGPDELTSRLVEARNGAIERIGLLTSHAAAKLEQDRAALDAWAAQELAPRVADELRTRIAAMLGAPRA